MLNSSRSKVLFIMTGSIACYKACQVISRLSQQNISVQVVATPSALKFIGEATLEGLSGNSVISDIYARGSMMDHIHLVRDADLVLVAPATANYINKISHGIGDDIASTLFLAHDFKKPFLIAPAMNTSMLDHPLTQESMKKLKSLGVSILDSATGVLACKEEGYGKLLDPDLILQQVLEKLSSAKSLVGDQPRSTLKNLNKMPRILITAGGTQEKIDHVRAITNLSTGSTGVGIASSLHELGASVTLLLSENSLYKNEIRKSGLSLKTFTDYENFKNMLFSEVQEHEYDFLIHSAAVSDYSVASIESSQGPLNGIHKISSDKELVLKLKKNPKLIDSIKALSKNKNLKLIGFKLTANSTESEIYDKVAKLFQLSGCDFVVHNDTSKIDKTKQLHAFSFCSTEQSRQIKFQECSDLDQLNLQISQAVLSEVNL